MPIFERDFASAGAWTRHPEIRHLFSRWVLPGEDAGAGGLRIGVRADCLNFYVRGQLLGRLRVVMDEPVLEIHEVYAGGIRKGDKRSHQMVGTCTLWRDDVTPEAIRTWIETAETYASAEKRFVDDLVAANPGVIDLEVGLPAGQAERSVPRVNLVVAQGRRIAFWEAKCSNNPELRARSEYQEDENGNYVRGIHLIHQLRRYQAWIDADATRLRRVGNAYRETARILLDLADAFGRPGEAARAAWTQLARTEEPELILPPALVVGNYRPDGHPLNEWEKQADGRDQFAHLAATFASYRQTIEAHGAFVVCCGRDDDRRLPALRRGRISAKPAEALAFPAAAGPASRATPPVPPLPFSNPNGYFGKG